ncbi:MAG: metallophosphoesterase family protein [Candidatus Omnitrophota bacterium]|jgi:putative phosphoesterase
MRYAIFSDIHGNLEAFQEALKFYKQERIDRFIFLGDIVGYGVNPKEVIALLKEINPVSIAGNHDWGVTNRLSGEHFNEYAEAALVWTKQIITEKEIKYINTFPLTYEEDNFFCVHGTLNDPQNFNYLSGINEARVNFLLLKQQILFVGHSHKAQIYYANSGGVFFYPQSEVTIKNNEKYIINVGSIGQPRDRDRRLSFCIYDTEEKLARIVRLDYNISAAAEKIINARLPAMLSSRLFIGL